MAQTEPTTKEAVRIPVKVGDGGDSRGGNRVMGICG